MKENKKLLTIGIPNYNGGKYLKETILSCRNLDLDESEYEILVVDNCSSDESVNVVRGLQGSVKNLRLVVNDRNYGRIGNWNRIIDLADGIFLLYQMVGDLVNKNSIKNDLIDMLEKGYFIRYGSQDYYGNNTRFFKKFSSTEKKEINVFFSFPGTLGDYLFFGYLGSSIFNLSIIKENGIRFDENLNFFSDMKFEYEYFKIIKYGRYSDKCLFRFNTIRDRFTKNGISTMFHDIIYLLDFESKKYGKKYNKTKLYFLLVSWIFALYVRTQVTKDKMNIKEVWLFIKKHNIPFYIVFLGFVFSPVMGILFLIHEKIKILNLPIFVVKNV